MCLTGDIDSPEEISSGQLSTIFDILDEHVVHYTFPITGNVLHEALEDVKEIVKHGDELAGHGDVHLPFKGQPFSAQLSRVLKTVGTFNELAGVRILGFRAPYLSGDIITAKAVAEAKLLYDSTVTSGETWFRIGGQLVRLGNPVLRAMLQKSVRLRPLKKALKGIHSSQGYMGVSHTSSLALDGPRELFLPFHPRLANEVIKVLEIPVSNMDDRSLIDVGPRYRDWRKVASVWIRNFDYYLKHNGAFVLLAHPSRIGTSRYAPALRALIEHAYAKESWFATLSQLSNWTELNQPSLIASLNRN